MQTIRDFSFYFFANSIGNTFQIMIADRVPRLILIYVKITLKEEPL